MVQTCWTNGIIQNYGTDWDKAESDIKELDTCLKLIKQSII